MAYQHLCYQESNEINPKGLVLAYLGCLVGAILLGYFYAVLVYVIPFVYVKFFITLGFGMVLGYLVRFMARLTHNRSSRSRMIMAVVVGLMGNYFQWTAFVVGALNQGMAPPVDFFGNLLWIFTPQGFLSMIGIINKLGMYSIGSMDINGGLLTAVWVVEFLIIIVVPAIIVDGMKAYPYSETFGKWYSKFTLSDDFEPIPSAERLVNDLQQNPLTAIDNLGNGQGWRHSKIHVYFLEGEEKQYLAFERIYIADMGKGSRESTWLLNNYTCNTSSAEAILKKYHHNRERLEVF